MSELRIEVHKREEFGKNANRRLRASGEVPAVVYGAGKEPVPIRVNKKTLRDLFRGGHNENAIFLLRLSGTDQERHTMIRDLQINPVTREILHLDFQRVLLDQKVRVSVQIELEGIPLGVRNEGAFLDFITREVEVECLPGKIPGHLTIDVTKLHAGEHVEAGQLEFPEGVELLIEPERVIAAVTHSRVHAEAEEGGEGGGLIEEAPVEPEVIGRGHGGQE